MSVWSPEGGSVYYPYTYYILLWCIITVKTTALEFTKLLYEAPEALEIRANTSMLQWKTMVRARALDSSAYNCSLALRLVLLLFLTELALS